MPLPGLGEGFFTLAKNTIISAFLALPIVLITITGFFASTTANVGMMILFLGQIFAVPAVQTALVFLRGITPLQKLFGLGAPLTYGDNNKLCSLSPVDVKADQYVPPVSYWLAHVIFFGTYVLTNAYMVFSSDPETKDQNALKVENRMAQTMTAFVITLVLFLAFIVLHIVYVGCDTKGSISLALLLYVPLGYGFFRLAEICGLRTADLFGIATKMFLPSSGDNVYPYACVNIDATR